MARERKTCNRCGARARHTWTVDPCALMSKTIKAKLCDQCDIEINRYILAFYRVPNSKKLMEAYRKKILGDRA